MPTEPPSGCRRSREGCYQPTRHRRQAHQVLLSLGDATFRVQNATYPLVKEPANRPSAPRGRRRVGAHRLIFAGLFGWLRDAIPRLTSRRRISERAEQFIVPGTLVKSLQSSAPSWRCRGGESFPWVGGTSGQTCNHRKMRDTVNQLTVEGGAIPSGLI